MSDKNKHIGIVACSAEGAALCYRTICIEGEIHGRHGHPEITMHTYPLGEYMRFIDAGDWEKVSDLMVSSAEKLARTGAEFVICPDNTIHQAFDLTVAKSPLPWLHIAEQVALEAERQGYGCLGILGTKYLMEGPVYTEKLVEKNITNMVPPREERELVNRIIFEELVNGRFTDEDRARLQKVIQGLAESGCDAVVLGCTELPLIISEGDSPIPTLDSTRLLALGALEYSMGGA